MEGAAAVDIGAECRRMGASAIKARAMKAVTIGALTIIV
jgi:hypothetical protein